MVYPIGPRVADIGDDVGIQFDYLIAGSSQAFLVTRQAMEVHFNLNVTGLREDQRDAALHEAFLGGGGNGYETWLPAEAPCQTTAALFWTLAIFDGNVGVHLTPAGHPNVSVRARDLAGECGDAPESCEDGR